MPPPHDMDTEIMQQSSSAASNCLEEILVSNCATTYLKHKIQDSEINVINALSESVSVH